MKKIDFSQIDLELLSDWGNRSVSSQVIFNRLLKSLLKYFREFRMNYLAFLEQFSYYDIYNATLYFLLSVAIIFSLHTTSSLITKLYNIEEDIITAKVNTKNLKENIIVLDRTNTQLSEIKKTISLIDKSIPNSPQTEATIFNLGSLLAQNKIPSPSRFFWTKLKPESIADIDIQKNFDVYSYNFASNASMPQITKFIDDLKSNNRLIDIKNLKLSPLANNNIWFSMTVWAYNNIQQSWTNIAR